MVILGLVVAACSGGGDDPVTAKENQAPSAVKAIIFPTNNLLCTSNVVDFSWGGSQDPDGDSVSYVLEISKNNLFSPIDKSFPVLGTFKTVTLEKGFAYYWRVKAVDSKNLAADYSSVNQFYTEGEGVINHLPFAPQLVAPTLGNSVTGNTTVNLEWNCSDADNDSLIYDVYFGTETTPITKVGTNVNTKSLNVSVNNSTKYYWKVIAKDGKGGESIGQIWNFNAY
ncbi:hypothetical protein ACSV4D_09005 [Flavobacterium sp. ARAG 55.4]|uniref:hypothetical protein n=1 Tax=Flavobacterium sp. ARAG 55.4 TaxID=3451357 RepID=UPI003F47F99E